jgi:methylated-DNA-[protein]-cysteine S-methyltransferase
MYISSPIGTIKIIIRGKNVLSACFVEYKVPHDLCAKGSEEDVIATQFGEYFAGKRQVFSINFDVDLPTQFQRIVWAEIRNIPFGQTKSYAEIAVSIGKPKAARAVGMACNRNPVNILIPCHRVIGSGGNLTGYAGGLLRKQWLLEHEKCRLI